MAKFRVGFVTNSSSSSYVCYGVDLWKLRESMCIDKYTDDEKVRAFDKYAEKTKLDAKKFSRKEKIDFVEFEYEFFARGDFRVLGGDYPSLGIPMQTIVEKYPDLKIKDIPEYIKTLFWEQFDYEPDLEFEYDEYLIDN